ncbi:hypothetical protein COCC4DRAFT_75597 [Bipolaris maydis ATCC 48331]|uniref:O-methyltransferase domain-containing protein n=2 Tax=Cochliobolus heterostrophus TaxID=5016 RepID=N4X2G2_COCH4|nr:uncharacterized protein COCC4DRAFT_75597 [Bipolaris maydis ATCC 48331]ENI00801.1 hypothetical protein COCC4DRAFT_75597 [Bipolaris maydis ATCC 48331]KAJ5028353.1 hypothetical protein J3E73DRAFT_430156 [Bipolaris maydis]KAJ6272526.1 hypothetical protein PSV08DRAFT_408349 [Bipolaris maydis]KAJ6279558.1 hypothetical protein J3E71DRAFT_203054 [Bipolaris maydis]
MDSKLGADLVSAAEHVANRCRDAVRSGPGPSDTASICAALDCVQSLLFQLEPTMFVQRLANQNQLLACVQWLGEFQVLAYLPLEAEDGLPIRDVAELADVPEAQLCRIVRLTTMGGFLREPRTGFVAHTALSASFVRQLAQLDATMFLAETVAPCMLRMAAVSRHSQGEGSAVDWSSQRVQRLWSSFGGALGGGDQDTPILAQIDWASVGPLAESHPALIFVVQMQTAATASATATATAPLFTPTTSHHNLHLCQRAHGTPQTVADAALYLMRVPAAVPGSIRPHIEAELRAHLPALQAQRSAILILTCPLLPEPGAVSRQTELLARLRDLARLQLVGSGLLTIQELVELVGSIHDAHGGLVIVKQLHAPNSAVVGFAVRYQPLLPLTGQREI